MTDPSGGALAPADSPIVVTANPAVDQLKSAARVLLVGAGGYFVGKGWLASGLVEPIVTVLLIGGPFLWAQIEVVGKKRSAVTVARSAPDSVAVVK